MNSSTANKPIHEPNTIAFSTTEKISPAIYPRADFIFFSILQGRDGTTGHYIDSFSNTMSELTKTSELNLKANSIFWFNWRCETDLSDIRLESTALRWKDQLLQKIELSHSLFALCIIRCSVRNEAKYIHRLIWSRRQTNAQHAEAQHINTEKHIAFT